MVLESLLDPESARRSPLKITVLSFVFVSLAVFATLFLASRESSFLLVLFVVVPSIPFVLNLFSLEESRFYKPNPPRVVGSRTLAHHLPTIVVLLAYFAGITAGFTFWFLVLPSGDSASLFSLQVTELESVRSVFQGKFVDEPLFFNLAAFELIFTHNLQVLALVVALSLLYGAGAVFVLVWNSSVISVFLGLIAAAALKLDPANGLLSGLGYGVFGILPHGVFELLAYLSTALACGILSQALVRREYSKPAFVQVAYDSVKLLAWAILFLALGALIECTGVPA
ncbi:MAG: stage II sporulation protein M [Candidatus Micrarchaeia archaeon]